MQCLIFETYDGAFIIGNPILPIIKSNYTYRVSNNLILVATNCKPECRKLLSIERTMDLDNGLECAYSCRLNGSLLYSSTILLKSFFSCFINVFFKFLRLVAPQDQLKYGMKFMFYFIIQLSRC